MVWKPTREYGEPPDVNGFNPSYNWKWSGSYRLCAKPKSFQVVSILLITGNGLEGAAVGLELGATRKFQSFL